MKWANRSGGPEALVTDALASTNVQKVVISRTEFPHIVKYEAMDKRGVALPRYTLYWHQKDRQRVNYRDLPKGVVVED